MFTGISGSYTSPIAAMIASSVGFGAVSPFGVQAAWAVLFTARLLVAFHRRDQRMPRQRRALHARRILVHAGQRLEPLHRFGQRRVAMRAAAGARHLTECVE